MCKNMTLKEAIKKYKMTRQEVDAFGEKPICEAYEGYIETKHERIYTYMNNWMSKMLDNGNDFTLFVTRTSKTKKYYSLKDNAHHNCERQEKIKVHRTTEADNGI